jgi:hypothetical protein
LIPQVIDFYFIQYTSLTYETSGGVIPFPYCLFAYICYIGILFHFSQRCGYNITCLKYKCHTSTRELRKQAKCRSSHRKDQRDLRQEHSQQTVVEQHHCTGPTSTKDVCTYIVEQTQGSMCQLKTFLTHRGIIQDTTVILSVLSVFICFIGFYHSVRPGVSI